jgi:hypothetical protein
MARRRRRLTDSFRPGSVLRAAVVSEAGALEREHQALIDRPALVQIRDSVNFDSALRHLYPEDHRWDYFVSVAGQEIIVGIEPHSASDSEVSTVLKKKQHAWSVITDQCLPGTTVSRWFWIASTKVRFSRNERASRQLDKAGITFVVSRLASFD